MKVTTHELTRWCGLAALVAGAIFAVIQPVHPVDAVASVTTNMWTLIIGLKLLMCFLFLAGITGLYVHQAEHAGLLGLVGYVLFVSSWALQVGFVFGELFILPPLATAAPDFVDSFLALARGTEPAMDIGAAAPAYAVVGVLYLLGGVVFGIATVRAKVFPRWPALLLAVTALITPLAVLVPHEVQRLVAIPMGIAIGWLGFSLWTFRRAT